jgi:hypothetical protein
LLKLLATHADKLVLLQGKGCGIRKSNIHMLWGECSHNVHTGTANV